MKKPCARFASLLILFSTHAHAKGAFESIAAELTKDLTNLPKGILVIAAPLETDVPCTKSEELAKRSANAVASKLEGAEVMGSLSAGDAATERAARKYPAYATVKTVLKKGVLTVTFDVRTPVKNSWDRLRKLLPPPLSHAFASRPFDDEIQSFLTPIALEQAKLKKFKHEESEVLAAACGDIDHDGGLEIALASKKRIVLGRFRGAAFVVEHSVLWTELGKRSAVPLRDPLQRLVFHEGTLAAGSSSFGGFALGRDLEKRGVLKGIPLWSSLQEDGQTALWCGALVPEEGSFAQNAIDCTSGSVIDPLQSVPSARFDFAAALPAGMHGPAVTLSHEAGGKLRLRRGTATEGDARPQLLENAGAQVALADLDLDGVPEVIATSSSETAADFVTVSSWSEASVRERRKYPTATPVRAVAACPAEEGGKPGFIAIVGQEVWLAR
jgi:hypothetical protein